MKAKKQIIRQGDVCLILERENARLRHAMQNILTMIDGKVDADMDSETGRYVPNDYGSIQSEIDQALGSLHEGNNV